MALPKPAAFWPFTIVSSVNDKLHVVLNGTAYTATVAAATHYSPSSLASAVKAALDAAISNGWNVTVGATGRVTVAGTSRFALRAAGENRLLRSEEFDNAAWTKGASATVSAGGGVVAPDGTLSDRLNFPVAGGYVEQSIALSPQGQTWTFSIWLAGTNGAGVTLTIIGQDGTFESASTTVGVTPALTRYSFTHTFANAHTDVRVRVMRADATYVDAWGAQFEQASAPRGYVHTVGSAIALLANVDPLFVAIGYADTTLEGSNVTGSYQLAAAWFAPQPVVDDTGDLSHHERAQAVALGGVTQSLHFGTRQTRTISLAFLPAHKTFKADEGANTNEAIERLIESGWARFRWFDDQTDLSSGTDYFLDLDSAKMMPRNRLAPGCALYSLTLPMRRYV